MFFRSPLPSLGLLKTVTHVLAILSPMSWPRFVTYVLATDRSGEAPGPVGRRTRRAPGSANSLNILAPVLSRAVDVAALSGTNSPRCQPLPQLLISSG